MEKIHCWLLDCWVSMLQVRQRCKELLFWSSTLCGNGVVRKRAEQSIATWTSRANAFERSSSTERMLLWIDTIVDAYQKSWHQTVIMMMALANSSAHVDNLKKLRNAHIINKSYIATAFPNAFAVPRHHRMLLWQILVWLMMGYRAPRCFPNRALRLLRYDLVEHIANVWNLVHDVRTNAHETLSSGNKQNCSVCLAQN